MMSIQITRQQMIEKVEADAASYDRIVNSDKMKKGSFAYWGARHRSSVAHNLARRLRDGHDPSTKEVVGRFGAGARFVEDDIAPSS
jgi:hypothetical protein